MHPYKGLPANSYWSSAVAARDWFSIEFKPERKFEISEMDRISTAGSCFAQHIARNLPHLGFKHFIAEPAARILSPQRAQELGYGIFSARYGNIYTARQLRQLIEFAFGLRPAELFIVEENGRWYDLLRPGIQQGGFDSEHDALMDRAYHLGRVKAMFENTELFIFTLGLTEAWFDEPSGVVFPTCPGVRFGSFRPERHKFVNFRVSQIVEDLRWCMAHTRSIQPKMKWLLTVSPVALAATATSENVLTASVHSKSILRAAAGEICDLDELTDYFPSLEICNHPASFGQFLESDLRGVSPRGVAFVMRIFDQVFGATGNSAKADDALAEDDIEHKLRAAIAAECDEAFNDLAMRGEPVALTPAEK